MASSCSVAGRAGTVLGLALLLGCGRQDVELARPRAEGGVAGSAAGDHAAGGSGAGPARVDDCSAAVPQELLAARPPLGWNGYNAFGCSPELNEAKVKDNVEALISSGMLAAGYQYVNLDRCWELARAEAKTRVFDPGRLPSGIEGLAALLHDRGLLLGVFAPIGDCLGGPGGDGYETLDAESYAAWGIDYVKYVACPGESAQASAVQRFAQALRGVERPIVLSLGSPPFAEWMRGTAQVWRTGGNATPTWASIVESVDATTPLAAYARPGAFNDPDMLEIGNGSLSEGEARVQLSVWSILAAPLLAGNDLSSMSDATRDILTNTEVIALDQDPLGLQGALVRSEGDIDVLVKPLASCGGRGVVLWNRGEIAEEVTLGAADLWLAPGLLAARDLWAHANIPGDADTVTVIVPPHDAVALRVTGVEPTLPAGEVYLSDLSWTYAVNGFGPVELDTSNGEDLPGDGVPMRLRGGAYDKGVGAHAPSLIRYRLGQRCSRFVADVGIDDETAGLGTAHFEVWADGLELFDSGVLTGTSPSRRVDIDVTGRRELRLFVDTGGDDYGHDHADWAGARLICEIDP